MLRRNGTLGLVLLMAGLGLAGCGGGEETTVAVTLQEFAVLPAQDTVPGGSVTFEATNEGPDDPHELVVIRTDLAPEALPTTPDGAVDEEGEGIEVIGEIEEFPVGETRSGTFDLEAGDYVLVCNIVEEEGGEIEAHYALGMRIGFVVT
ncbi:MAG TPA: hypothetical protein VMR89_10760 [Actinomycetota bacterium]|nr:hypothetical protein [Actinomycetota bacterium]